MVWILRRIYNHNLKTTKTMELKGIRRILDIYETKKCYSVWVGGIEVNDYYLTKDKAIILADEYKNEGYKTNIRKEI